MPALLRRPAAATMADAKAIMSSFANCRDVFVTENGQRSEPVIGWVTNVDIVFCIVDIVFCATV